jgi:quinoprotein glucose dehydrogenase
MNRRRALPFALAGAVVVPGILGLPLMGQAPPGAEWRTYAADLRGTRYSPLAQIDAANFNKLEVAWRFKTDHLGPRPEYNLQATPLVVDGMLYSTGGTRRAAFALDAATGEMRWMHSEDEGRRAEVSSRKLSRGLAYWSDGRESRIFYVTIGYRLVGLDAKTGVPVRGFGRDGIVDLKAESDQALDLETGDLALQATPIVVKDAIIIGSAHLTGTMPKSRKNEKGAVRAYDARTGTRLWIFHTIPRPGEFGNETWENDSWSYTGNTGVWGQMTADEELGMVYVPVETPTNDYYGGHRPGNGLFGNSLVALDVRTGKRVWHYQFIHHDVWDWDLPCAPILIDITVNGRALKAVAQPTKQAWVYVFDRTNGQPVWPIEERPAPPSDIPGERLSPTQPFPTKPPPFDRQGVSLDDLIDLTPELKAEAVQVASRYKIGPIFTPPVVSRAEGPLGTLMLPNTLGGANWYGGAFDPETKALYVYSITSMSRLGLVNNPELSDMNYIDGPAPTRPAPAAGADAARRTPFPASGAPISVQGLPLVKPPWGRITAYDMNAGEILWQVPHGETADEVKNHPALKGVAVPRTGRVGRLGTLVTKTLVIAGEGGFFTAPNGRRGAMLRAYDKRTGQDAGAVYMPAPQTGSPMTYMLNGKQYLAVAVSGGAYSGELLGFRLSE